MRRVVLALAVVAALVAVAGGGWQLSRARTFQVCGGLTSRVQTSEKLVALTFDDGPDPAGTQEMLDVLARKKAQATFYLTGGELARRPDLGRAVADAGHELGNHTYSHDRMVLVTPGKVADEIGRTDALIRKTGYRGDITVRPPNGKKLLTLPCYLRAHDRRTVMWDVEPNSYPEVDGSASAIVRHTADRVQPGSIVLQHGMYEGRVETRKAIAPLVDRLRDDGYRLVTVSELLAAGD